MQSAELHCKKYSHGKLVVVKQIDDETVEVYAIGDGGQLVSYSYGGDTQLSEDAAHEMGVEYGLGYVAGRES